MTIAIEVDGINYTKFLEAFVDIRLDALSNTFRFQATSNDTTPLPFGLGQACRVLVNDKSVLNGFIELINVDGSSDTRIIDISGRDKTGDLLDSSVSISDIRTPISLKGLIELAINDIGASIEVVDLAKPAIFNKAEDLLAPETSQTAWDFIESYARKRQVLLTSNGEGDVVITQGSGEEIDATIQHLRQSNTNNVLKYAVSYDSTGRYNKYRFNSQLNPLALIFGGLSTSSDIVDQSSEIIDDAIRRGRQFILIAESSSSSAELKKRAEWEVNIRKARSRVYSATVREYTNQTGELWDINKLVKVNDEYAGINSRMLVNSLQFSLTRNTGRRTSLSFVDKNAYTLALDEPVIDKTGGAGLVSFG